MGGAFKTVGSYAAAPVYDAAAADPEAEAPVVVAPNGCWWYTVMEDQATGRKGSA